MQKLPEAPGGIMGDACAQKGTIPKRNPFSFSSDRWIENTNIFLAAGVFYVARWLTVLLVEAISVTSNLRLGTYLPNRSRIC